MDTKKGMANISRLASAVDQAQITEESYVLLIRENTQRPSLAEWREVLRYWFLVLGSSLMVIGVTFFVASNWDGLGRFQKLGMLELIFTGLFLGVLLRGVNTKAGHVLVVAASVMVGVLLTVFGQIYQAGADPFWLFFIWSLLLLPWCLVARSNVLWILQSVLLSTAVWNYAPFSSLANHQAVERIALSLLIINIALAVLWEYFQKTSDWMLPGVTEFILVLALAPATFSECVSITKSESPSMVFAPLAIAILSLIAWRQRHLGTMVGVSVSLFCLGTSWMIGFPNNFDKWATLAVGVGILIELGVIVRALSGIQRRNRESVSTSELALTPKPQDTEPVLEEDEELPWYVQALVGFGAWFATLFIAISLMLILDGSDLLLFGFGVILFLTTLILQQKSYRSGFVQHSLLSGHLSATLILIYSFSNSFSVAEPMDSLLSFALFCVSIYFYSDTVGRFIFAGGAFTCSWWVLISLWDSQDHVSVLLLVVTGILVTVCSLNIEAIMVSRVRTLFLPVFRAVVALFLFWSTILLFFPLESSLEKILSAGILASCLYAIWSLGLGYYLAVGITLMAVVTHSVPSLIIAILVYGTAFLCRDIFVKGFAIIALICSAILFYDNLEMTLLNKSIILVTNGLVLLILRLVLGATVREEDTELAH